jgi:uncharacterized damage-inducible protein DinB
MNEINNLLKQFTSLQHGESWIGVNFKESLQEVNAAMAAAEVPAGGNSIWQLVSHVIYWRSAVVNRLNGSNDKPIFADFRLPAIQDDLHWKQTLIDFESAYHLLRSCIHHFKPENLYKLGPDGNNNYYELMVGCLQHDAYHLGQISLMKKLIGKKG